MCCVLCSTDQSLFDENMDYTEGNLKIQQWGLSVSLACYSLLEQLLQFLSDLATFTLFMKSFPPFTPNRELHQLLSKKAFKEKQDT